MRSRLKELVTQREIKIGRRIKQAEIAEATGLNPNTISRWMSPEPFERFETKPILRFIQWLDCSLSDLIYVDYDGEDKAS